MARKTRLGFLGPGIVIAGLVIGGFGAWMIYKNKPEAGGIIDTFVVDATTKIVVRAEAGGDRSFVELVSGDEVQWQAMIPPYAGAPGRSGVSWSDVAVAVRVVRDGKAELFSLARANGSKLGGTHLAPEHDAIKLDAPGPLSLSDHLRSYEIVAGEGWTQVVAFDLKLGSILWTKELGATPVTGGAVEGGQLVLEQAGTKYGKRWLNVFTGKEDRSADKQGKPWEAPLAPESPAKAESKPL